MVPIRHQKLQRVVLSCSSPDFSHTLEQVGLQFLVVPATSEQSPSLAVPGPFQPPLGLISKQTVITFQTDGIRHSIRELMHRVTGATGTLGLTCLHLKA